MPTFDDVQRVKQLLSGRLLRLGLRGGVTAMSLTRSVAVAVAAAGKNVHAVGVGRKIVEGKATADLCVRIYVVQKLSKSLLSARDILPAQIDGITTDVIESAPAFAQAKRARRRSIAGSSVTAVTCTANRQNRQRPIVAGISAAHRDVTAGTIGFFCRSLRHGDDPQRTYVVSNNHVFADLNNAMAGDDLLQPGPADGGMSDHHFADLVRFVEIQLGSGQSNRVDAALGLVRRDIAVTNEICSIGAITGIISAEEEMPVRKHGRTTGLTDGKVTDISYDALVGMNHNDPDVVALFESQLRIENAAGKTFALGGDSGSAIVHGSRPELVGLYFAGPDSGSYGVANPIQDVMTSLEIELL
jgi:hypothetical protein